MRNSLNSSKGQFFVLTAFAIISILYFISKWLQPYTIIDTSSIASQTDSFVFNNIIEKANETVQLSDTCQDINYNLGEFKQFITKKFGNKYDIKIEYQVNCLPNMAVIKFNITQVSKTSKIYANFTIKKKI